MADRLFRGGSRLAAGTIIVLLIAIGVLLAWNSRLTWQTFGLSFLTGLDWDPVAGIYGIVSPPGIVRVFLFHAAFALPYATFLFRNFFIGIPHELLESARMDGANDARIFRRIILPLATDRLTIDVLLCLTVFYQTDGREF